MMNMIRRVTDHPAPFAILGGVSIVWALAQNDLFQMLSGLCCLIIAIWNYKRTR